MMQERSYSNKTRVYGRGTWLHCNSNNGEKCLDDIHIDITHYRRGGDNSYEETIDRYYEIVRDTIKSGDNQHWL